MSHHSDGDSHTSVHIMYSLMMTTTTTTTTRVNHSISSLLSGVKQTILPNKQVIHILVLVLIGGER
jgi:hypothetical protein